MSQSQKKQDRPAQGHQDLPIPTSERMEPQRAVDNVDYGELTASQISLEDRQLIQSSDIWSRIRKYKCVLLSLVVLVLVFLSVLLIYTFSPSASIKPEVIEKTDRSITGVFSTCCQQHARINETLYSFFKLSQTSLNQVIVVNEGKIDQKLVNILKGYPNVTFLSEEKEIGHLSAIDEALKLVKTPYVYYNEDSRKMIKGGVIRESIDLLEKEPKLLQTWYSLHEGAQFAEGNKVDPNWQAGGFSFLPAVWRMADYRLLEGGFAGVTKDILRGVEMGTAQDKIRGIFKAHGYYVRQAKEEHYQYLKILNSTSQKESTKSNSPSSSTTQAISNKKSTDRSITGLFFTCCKRFKQFNETLSSFFSLDKASLNQVILVNEGRMDDEFQKILSDYPLATIILTGQRVGHLRAIDLALKLVKTPYVYYNEDSRKMIKGGVIRESIDLLEKEPKLLQTWYSLHEGAQFAEGNKVDPNWQAGGFSFLPAVWRMADYRLLEGGFAGVTKDILRGVEMGTAQDKIRGIFKAHGYYVRQAKEEHFSQLLASKSQFQKIQTISSPQTKPIGVVESVPSNSNRSVTGIFLTCCKRHYMLKDTIQSFFLQNQTPLKQIFLMNDGQIESGLAELINFFPTITVVSTGTKEGQIRSIDLGLRLVETPYVYYCENDRKMLKGGAINESILRLEKEPKLLQVWTEHDHGVNILEDGRANPNQFWGGFSFFPAVWRMSDYNMFKGGFTGFSKDISKGGPCGPVEGMILNYFRSLGYYVKVSLEEHYFHSGVKFHQLLKSDGYYQQDNQADLKQFVPANYLQGSKLSAEQMQQNIEFNRSVTAVFHSCCKRFQLLKYLIQPVVLSKEVKSDKMILIYEGKLNDSEKTIVQVTPDLVVIEVDINAGKMKAIDEALKLVKTPYVYYNEDNRKMIKGGVIRESIDLLEKEPKLLQTWYSLHEGAQFAEGNKVDPNWQAGGFSFLPAVWRMADYRMLEGGFAGVTKDILRGVEMGTAQDKIRGIFKAHGYYVRQAKEEHYQYLAIDYTRWVPYSNRRPRKNRPPKH